MKASTKTVNYRGGVVSLEIPTHWKEEYEPKGGGTFYEDRPDSGTLRLNVLTFSSKENRPSEETIRMLTTGEPHEVLSCGFPMKHYMCKGGEESEILHLYRWEISVPVPPIDWNVVCFSYTIVAGQEEDPRIAEELRVVNQVVRAARFSTAKGVTG